MGVKADDIASAEPSTDGMWEVRLYNPRGDFWIVAEGLQKHEADHRAFVVGAVVKEWNNLK